MRHHGDRNAEPVLGEENRPAYDRVRLSALFDGSTPAALHLRDLPSGVDLRDYSVTTDADGRWSTDKAPADLAPPGLKLTHPDFVGDEFVRVTDLPVERLRDGTAVSVMTPGVSIGGRVLDPDNKPVRDAVVALGETRFGRGAPKVKSDAEGRFLLPHCRPGRMQRPSIRWPLKVPPA